MKKALSLVLALILCLSLTAVTAFAAADSDRGSAKELSAGQSDTFKMPNAAGDVWYKFNLSAASKVVITLSIQNHDINDFARIVGVYHEIGGGNQMPAYVGISGAPLGERTQERSFPVGMEPEDVPSRTGTYFLAAGWYYVNVDYRDMNELTGPLVTIKIDSVDPISNTGGLEKESARAVDPSKEVIKQSRFEQDDIEVGYFYYTFTLSEDAEVSIKKSVELVPSKDERVNMRSSLWFNNDPNELEAISGKVDGEDAARLEIWEKRDNPLTQTITCALTKGTYYVVLYNSWAFPGTEYTLSFSMKSDASPDNPAPPPPQADQPDSWAAENVDAAISKNLVPDAIKDGGWKNPTTRVAAAEAMVMLIEATEGRTMAQIADEKGWDLSTNQFADTSSQAVTFLRHAGIVQGIGDNKYDPDGAYSRAATVTLLGIIAEKLYGQDVRGDNPFTDVPDYAAPYIGYAAEVFGVKGMGGGLFDPDSPMVNQMTAYLSYIAYLAWSDV